MEDAVRPSEQAFKTMYERGYQTWSSLHETTTTSIKTGDCEIDPLWWNCVSQLQNAFPQYPYFPEDLAVDASFSNAILAKGVSTWGTAHGCDLPSFDEELLIPVASERPIILNISDPQKPTFAFPQHPSEEDNDHMALLILAWTYILSARWAEIIPGASGPRYNECMAEWDDAKLPFLKTTNDSVTSGVFLGDINDDASRWWAAVVAIEGGWNATISSEKGHILNSPWHTKIISKQRLALSRHTKPPLFAASLVPAQYHAASFNTALDYLSSYCQFHQVVEQSQAALAATLLLPMATYDNKRVQLSPPRVGRKLPVKTNTQAFPPWHKTLNQLDRLLTLSCNAAGTKALLASVFFEPGVECNICGAWLQGTFAFLDSVQDPETLLRILIQRDPALAFLWLGAFITGIYKGVLQEGRQCWWKIDLNAASWTGTLMSFIQEPVPILPSEKGEIPRADECRLMYLGHDKEYTTPPLFPFAPFGSTVLVDTNLDVRQHAQCQVQHLLEYQAFTWKGLHDQHVTTSFSKISFRVKNGGSQSRESKTAINYDELDYEDDENSMIVTRNIFCWLRDTDGFPITERAIREHEWIDNLDSDDDEPCTATGDALSSVGGNLHGWLWKTATTRSNSL